MKTDVAETHQGGSTTERSETLGAKHDS